MSATPIRSQKLAPVSLTLWGCGIIILWWTMVLSVVGAAAWLIAAGVRLMLGA